MVYITWLNKGFNDLDFDSNSINYLVVHVELYIVSCLIYNAIICFKLLLFFLFAIIFNNKLRYKKEKSN